MFGSIAFGLFAFLFMAHSPSAHAVPWLELSSSAIEPESSGTLFKYNPSGSGFNLLSPECHHSQLAALIDPGTSPRSIDRRVNRWLTRCQPEIMNDEMGKIGVMLEYLNINHSLIGSRHIKKVVFTLSDGRRQPALLALKPDDGKRRPMVIAKCGIYCNASESGGAKSLFMHLFEDSPFHLVILANSSGVEFAKANQSVAFSGFDEGYQLLDVARILTSPEAGLSERISTLHTVGLSLGSLGVLYSSLYASYPENGFPPLASALAICPVVDLEGTISRGLGKTPRGLFFRILTLQALRQMLRSVPILGDLLNLDEKVSQSQLRSALTKGAVQYYGSLLDRRPWPYAPFQGLRIKNETELWDANRFQDHVAEIKVPTLLVHSSDDYLVESDINSSVVSSFLKRKPSEMIGVVGFTNGNHCALNAGNGWDTMTSLYRSFILANSPGSESLMALTRVPIAEHVRSWSGLRKYRVAKDEKVLRATWRFEEGSDRVKLELNAFTPYPQTDHEGCYRYVADLGNAPSMCVRRLIGTVPVRAFRKVGLRVPRDEREANTMTRWLNTHSDILSENGRTIRGTRDFPGSVAVQGQFEL